MSWETLALLVGIGLLVLGGIVRRRFTCSPRRARRSRTRTATRSDPS